MQSKTILITGASSGIGRASAIKLAADGHHIIATARREELLTQMATGNRAAITPLRLDVRDAQSIENAVARVREHAPDGLDVLVNNAGYALSGPVETLPTDAVRAQFETNVIGLLGVTRAFLPDMRARGIGRIINLSSVVGRVTFPGMGIYGATKYAVEAICDALRIELAGFGVDVVLIEPAFVNTDIGTASAHAASEHATPNGNGDYAAMQAAIGAYLEQQISNAMPATKVAEVIAKAATAKRPKPRYVVPRNGRVLIGALNILPTRIADSGKRRTAKLS
jgi:NADP-dependent 3-hydroxy acid dehydrogenase YdfG